MESVRACRTDVERSFDPVVKRYTTKMALREMESVRACRTDVERSFDPVVKRYTTEDAAT